MLKLEKSFECKGKIYFVMFCIPHTIKNVRNAFFRKDNEHLNPKLNLSTGNAIEAGTCSSKWTRDLCHENKCKLTRNFRMNGNVTCIDNLSKQKVSPALALFDKNLTATLENEYGEKVKGTWMFLRTINDHVMQLLLTASTSKGLKIKEATIFTSPIDIRLKFFREISSWLTDDWFPSIKKLPINKNALHDEHATSKTKAEHAEPI